MRKDIMQPLDLSNLPKHIAFIMDGNGRWAKKKGLPRLFGHNAGTETIKRIVKESNRIGIPYISFYAFSTENWKRPTDEVNGLMKILVKFVKSDIEEMHQKNIKVNILGDYSKLPEYARAEVEKVIEKTKNNTGMQFNIALNYGGRDEILCAVKKLVQLSKNPDFDMARIDQAYFETFLYTAGMPDPDLMIRTSGEMRLSNFMLWQMAYTEFIFESVCWPDFTEEVYQRAIQAYQFRNRRYGSL